MKNVVLKCILHVLSCRTYMKYIGAGGVQDLLKGQTVSIRHKYPIKLCIFSILNDNTKGSDYSEDQARKKTLDEVKAKVKAKYCAK